MLSEFVFAVLSESKDVLQNKERCRCSSTNGLMAVYDKLFDLLRHLLEHEQAVLDCFTIFVDNGGPRTHYYPDDSLLPNPPGVGMLSRGELQSLSGPTDPLGFFERVRKYYHPPPGLFKLDGIQVTNGELPFLVSEFVREGRFRLVSIMGVIIILLVSSWLLTVHCLSYTLALHLFFGKFGQSFRRCRAQR